MDKNKKYIWFKNSILVFIKFKNYQSWSERCPWVECRWEFRWDDY